MWGTAVEMYSLRLTHAFLTTLWFVVCRACGSLGGVCKIQHEQFMELFSSEYKEDPEITIPWDNYAAFWLEFPNITVEQQNLVTDEAPTLEGLVKLGKDKEFSKSLRETGLSVLKAKAVADVIHERVYKKQKPNSNPAS